MKTINIKSILKKIETAKIEAVIRYAMLGRTSDDWRKLRTLIDGSRCRENGPYCYIRNGGKARARGPGAVAQFIVNLAENLTNEKYPTPRATWCGSWPRTSVSRQAEQIGDKSFDKALNDIRDIIVENDTKLKIIPEDVKKEFVLSSIKNT